MIHKYTNIKTVIGKIYRDLGATDEINEYDAIEWIAEALEKIGAYAQYEEISEYLEVDNGIVQLPLNFHRLKDISYNNNSMSWASKSLANNYDCPDCQIPNCCTEYTFYINDGYLVTNIVNTSTTGDLPKVCIVYLGIPVDDEGYPLIPDDVYYMEALASYVTYRLDYQRWRKGSVPDKVYQAAELNWLYYVKAAKGAANMPSAAQLENIKNVWNRLIPKQNAYNGLFKGLSKQEQRKLK